jgi:BMFP domain-containing protein YqiC
MEAGNSNKILDDIAKLAGDALGAIGGLKDGVEDRIRACVQSYLSKMNLVSREEFEILKDMVVKLRIEQEKLLKKDE